MPLDLGCFGPVARSRRALTSGARRAAVSEAGPLALELVCWCCWPLALVAGLLVADLWELVCGNWPLCLFVFAEDVYFLSPTSP